MKIVLDTNCLLAAVPANSDHKWLYDAFMEERFEWAVSTEILDEYAEKIGEFFSKAVAEYVLNSLDDAPNVLFAEPFFRWNLITNDPDDRNDGPQQVCRFGHLHGRGLPRDERPSLRRAENQ